MDVLWKPVARGLSRVTVCAVFLTPAIVSADPIGLTGGAVDVLASGPVEVSLIGDEFSFAGHAHITGGIFEPQQCVVPECPPGTSVSLRAMWAGNDLGGTAVYRGSTYTAVGGLDDTSGQMLIELISSFVIPPGGGLVLAPFTLNGQFAYPVGPHNEPFPVMLTGRGTAHVWLSELQDAPGFFSASRVRYQLDAPVPTPEPGSLGLLLGGLAWAASKGRRYLRR